MKIAYLGPQGTYSEEIALQLYPTAELVPYPSIAEAILAVEGDNIDECVVPLENSLEGSINITMDMLAHETELFITQEIAGPIRHNLLVKSGGIADITTIVSHPQPLAQCRHYLTNNFSHVACRAVDSTAAAMEIVATGEPGYAAIGSARGKILYGLNIVASDIQDSTNNHTRFVALGRQAAMVTQGDRKTSIICQIHSDQPGGLCNILEEFARWNVNLTRIESRPARTGLGKYLFFLDMEGSMSDEKVQMAVNAVRIKSQWFKNLGSYPVRQYVSSI